MKTTSSILARWVAIVLAAWAVAPAPVAAAQTEAKAVPDVAAPDALGLSPWTREIVKLARAGIDADVMLAYVDNCAGTFNLGADEIIQLAQMGVSNQVINLMIQHDAEVACGMRTLTASTVPGAQPTVHITFAPSGDASVRATPPAATTPLPAVSTSPAAPGEDGELFADSSAWPPMSELESALSEASFPLEPPAPGPAAVRAYAVRQPYPEQVLPPILVVKAASRNPNVLVIQFSP
jgi:hypothetical protein